MSRVTFNDLKESVQYYNEVLVESGSNVLFSAQKRNGYNTLDLHFINENGEEVIQDCIEAGSPRKCIARLATEATTNVGKHYYGLSITRKTAKVCLSAHIDFGRDPAQLSHFELSLLSTWARLTNYKQPRNHSRGYGFFSNLKNKVTLWVFIM